LHELEDGDLPLLRSQRDTLYGDVSEELRDEDSIIAYLLAYCDTVRATQSGEPIAESLPRIRGSLTPRRFLQE
jgi:hypothetical protein